MSNRRKFILDTALAAGAVIFAQPVKALSRVLSSQGDTITMLFNDAVFVDFAKTDLSGISLNRSNEILVERGRIQTSEQLAKVYTVEAEKLKVTFVKISNRDLNGFFSKIKNAATTAKQKGHLVVGLCEYGEEAVRKDPLCRLSHECDFDLVTYKGNATIKSHTRVMKNYRGDDVILRYAGEGRSVAKVSFTLDSNQQKINFSSTRIA